jgi:hypothetical protein
MTVSACFVWDVDIVMPPPMGLSVLLEMGLPENGYTPNWPFKWRKLCSTIVSTAWKMFEIRGEKVIFSNHTKRFQVLE